MIRHAIVITLLLGHTCFAELTQIGNVVATETGDNFAQFSLDSGAVARVDLLDAGLARVRINPTGEFSERESLSVETSTFGQINAIVVDTESAVWMVAGRIVMAVVKSPFRVIAFHPDGSLMSADTESAVVFDPQAGFTLCRKYLPRGEAIFGLGMRGGPIDRRDRTIFMSNTDFAGYEEFSDPLYQSYPLYYGLYQGRAYGVYLDNPASSYFDVGHTDASVLMFGALQGELDYYLISGPDPQEVSLTYGRLTGFNPLPPKWSLGYHHSRYGWLSAAEILDVGEQLREQDFPADTLWFDIDYMNNRAAFTWNPLAFPDPIGLHNALAGLGYRTIYINEPCIRHDDPIWAYMDALEFFVKNGFNQSLVSEIWFGDVSWIDFSNQFAFEWYKTQLRTFLSTGIDGLWNDLNEPANNFMPDAVYDFNGDPRSDAEARNLYALLANKLAFQAQRELRPDVRPWNFSRAGFAGIQRYAHTWSGDAPSTFDSLRVSIQMSASMGLSGQNQFGHDTGGFLGSPSAELFVRWLEFSLFTPLFRNHSINTSEPREPWVYGEPTTSIVRDIIKQRYRLVPYIYTLFEEASRSGLPVLMPTFFFGEDDTQTYDQDTEYLFGPYLLVAPVFESGAITRTLYLPAGSQWIHFQSDQVYPGGDTVTVDAPIGGAPLFIRSGGLLVQGEAGRYVDDPAASQDLTIDAYPIADSTFTLYEDDGISYAYEAGEYLRTSISIVSNGEEVICSSARLDGSFVPQARRLKFRVHLQPQAPSLVTLDDAPLASFETLESLGAAGAGWYYDAASQVLTVLASDAPLVEILIA